MRHDPIAPARFNQTQAIAVLLKISNITFNVTLKNAASSRLGYFVRLEELSEPVRQRLKRLPPPYQAHFGIVPPPPPDEAVSILAVAQKYRAAEAVIIKIDTLAAELPDPYLISRILTRREAVSSSAIEGTQSTLDELLAIDEGVAESATAASRQVRSYALALEDWIGKAQDRGRSIFNADLISTLHRSIMQDDPNYKDKPGALRSRVVWIGRSAGNIAHSTYNPTPPEDIPACLNQHLGYLRDEGGRAIAQGLIMRMAIAHAHFEAVHPFQEGNGRVGRLLLPLMMAAESHAPLYISPHIEANRQAYYDALKVAQQRLEWTAIIGFMADAVLQSVQALLATRDALSRLKTIWESRRQFRASSAAARALSILPHHPIVTVNRLVKLLAVSFPAAAQAVEQLSKVGILIERTGYKRNRVFAADEALLIINRPFGDEPILPSKGPEDLNSTTRAARPKFPP
ncbi:MAG TPA: Fic family protein [Alphaproteobacteria bacterium]